MTTATETNQLAAPAVEALLEKHGETHRPRIEAGVERAARQWKESDGDAAAFTAFCSQHFVGDRAERTRLLDRFEKAMLSVQGHLYEINRDLRRWADLRGDEMPGVDDVFAKFDPAPDLSDQFYRQQLAFIALLNFDRPTLADMLAEGSDWDVDQWAEVRLGKAFGPRVPAEVNDLARELGHQANMWVAEFHIPVGTLVDADNKKWFEPDRKLIAHWLVREEIKAGYNDPEGLGKQRALSAVIGRYIDGSLPTAVMEQRDHTTWSPETNTLDGQPATDTIGTIRYERWLDQLD
ncbi:MAG: hypothetical protein ACF8NJ_02025, partial [Phycisphaerales bacterium JB038]